MLDEAELVWSSLLIWDNSCPQYLFGYAFESNIRVNTFSVLSDGAFISLSDISYSQLVVSKE